MVAAVPYADFFADPPAPRVEPSVSPLDAGPCDGCAQAERCAATASACAAFASWFKGKRSWEEEPRKPSGIVGRRLGLQ